MPIPTPRWLASASTSSFYAAEALARGDVLVDAALQAALTSAAEQLSRAIAERTAAPATFFDHLIPLSASIDSNRQLAEVLLAKVVGPPRQEWLVNRFTGLFTDLEGAFVRAVPGAVDELALRSEPLRQHWEARGPGLLASVCRLTEPDLVPEQADLILVQPVLGGGGRPCLPHNAIAIEALLANPWPELPEVLRLGWLWSQLNADLPKFQGEVPRHRLAALASQAMVPVILQAGVDVEMAACHPSTIAQALEVWRIPASDHASLADTLWQWWDTYCTSRPAWGVALGALDRMLQGA